ncbi:MAG TPA: acylphosphatase [Vicinamibacterales bacterium]|jgi:acylphosphatase|nr:acylphosphatase [Vicinamibacterales bacterium]
MRVARRFVISGRVQGVGFRYFTEAVAQREGIHGWVKNRPDGCVETLAEGESVAMARFEDAIRRGPHGARVARVEVEDGVPSGRETGFTIQ